MEEGKQRITVVAAGDFPTHPRAVQAIADATFVVCCDSAYLPFASLRPRPASDFVVVGDGDSLPPDVQRQLGTHFHHESEQEDNDLTKAMRYIDTHFPTTSAPLSVTIVGATGKREDHTLGNISLLAYYLLAFPRLDITLLTDYGTFDAFRGQRTFSTFHGQQISIFSLTPDIPVSASGLQWPLHERKLLWWWEGTLNTPIADRFSVAGGTIVVFRTYDPK